MKSQRVYRVIICLLVTAVVPTVGSALAQGSTAAAELSLGEPQHLFNATQFGMQAMPDQQPVVLQRQDGSYLVFLNGAFGRSGNGRAGYVGLFATSDFLTYTPVSGNATRAEPVFGPSCASGASDCIQNFDAHYVGANAVFTASNGTDLLMIYNGVNSDFGGPATTGFYAEIGLARSSDQGLTWTREGAIIRGPDPKPSASQASAAAGTPQPTAIESGDYMYVFYPYFPTPGSPDDGPAAIQVARAPIGSDGAPGSWTKYDNGAFDSQPGLGGIGSPVISGGNGCARPAQPSVAFSTTLNAYVMTYVCENGWFFSTSPDLLSWTTPAQFLDVPGGEFRHGQPTYENLVLVTPGEPGQVIDQAGYVLYAYRNAWGEGAGPDDGIWMRPFTFQTN